VGAAVIRRGGGSKAAELNQAVWRGADFGERGVLALRRSRGKATLGESTGGRGKGWECGALWW
jgi:hypothetical protein